MKARKGSQDGFTLVEAVIAVAILLAAMGAAAITYQMATRYVASSRNQMAALHQARNQMEQLKHLNFGDAALGQGTYTFNNSGFTGAYAVTNVNANTKNITVSVNYNNPAARNTAQATLSTLITTPLH